MVTRFGDLAGRPIRARRLESLRTEAVGSASAVPQRKGETARPGRRDSGSVYDGSLVL